MGPESGGTTYLGAHVGVAGPVEVVRRPLEELLLGENVCCFGVGNLELGN